MTNIEKVSAYAMGAEWQSRIKYLLIKAAIAVMAEDVGTASHAERIAFSRKVLAGSAHIPNYAIAVATNGTVATTIIADGVPIDGDAEFTVNSMFTAFSL